jgi:uncharacterized protein (DUF1919 family)
MKLEPRPLEPEIDAASSALEAPPILAPDSKSGRVRLATVSAAAAIPIDSAIPISGISAQPLPDLSEEASIRTWKHSFRDVRNRFGVLVNRAGLEHEKFTVFSNDCWGQALYSGYGLPYQTPLVGSGMYSDCFLRFLGDIEGYLQSPLRFVTHTRYPGLQRIRNQRRAWPIAVLREDVEIHFMHYQSEYTSRRAWEAGLENLHIDRIAVKFTADKDGATEAQVEQFAALPFERKLLISRRSRPEIACAVQTPDFVINGAVMFRRSLKYFDCTHWLNTGEIATDTPRVWLSKLIYARGA